MVNLSVPQPEKNPMVNLSVPQPEKNPMVNSSVSTKEQRLLGLKNWLCFPWMGLRDNQEHVMDRLPNIISNPDFSVGTLAHWNCLGNAEGLVIVNKSPYPKSQRETYALVYIRNQWQGLEQDINVFPDVTYELHARVGVLGLQPDHTAEVQATLVLQTEGSSDHVFQGFARVDLTSNAWTNLEGSFNLNAKYHRVRFYLEVLHPGVNLIVSCVDLRPLHDPS